MRNAELIDWDGHKNSLEMAQITANWCKEAQKRCKAGAKRSGPFLCSGMSEQSKGDRFPLPDEPCGFRLRLRFQRTCRWRTRSNGNKADNVHLAQPSQREKVGRVFALLLYSYTAFWIFGKANSGVARLLTLPTLR